MPGFFEDVCMCTPPNPRRMDERAGWQDWTCPNCGARWFLEHFADEDGKYLGSSWSGELADQLLWFRRKPPSSMA